MLDQWGLAQLAVLRQNTSLGNRLNQSILKTTRRRPRSAFVSMAFLIVTMAIMSSVQITILPLAHAEAVTATVAVGVNPSGIAVDTSTNLIYASNYGLNGTFPSTLSVINGSNNLLIATITVGVNPAAVGVDSQTHKIYVANYNSTDVSVITGTSNTTTTIPVMTHPSGVAVDAATNRIYVTNMGNGTVSVIDGTTNRVIATVTVGRSPVGVAVIPATNKVYVSNSLDGTVSVIDGQTNTVIKTVAAGSDPGRVAANNSTHLIYVVNSNSSSGMVTVIDGSTDTVAYTIPIGAYPTGIDLNPQTNKIYVANSADGTVSVVDGFTRTEVNTVSLASGSFPGAVGVNPLTNEIYVVNGGGRRTLSIISGNSTSTALTCNPSSVLVNSNALCTATVTDISGSGAITPTGTLFFSSTGPGSFNATSCTISGTGTTGSCTISYTPTAVGSGRHTIFGTYGGDPKHMSGSGNAVITVTTSSVGGTEVPIDKLGLLELLFPSILLLLGGIAVIILFARKPSMEKRSV